MSQLQQSKYMAKLDELIKLARSEISSKPEYEKMFSDSEILGIMVSKKSEWELSAIMDVLKHALEDSNLDIDDLKEYL